MSSSRWIRLDTTWSQSEWVASMSPEARLAWVELLCHVKAHGYSGATKRLAPSVFARVTGVTRNALKEMEEAAITDGALVIDGDDWVITGWSGKQNDPNAAERMRRYRERKKQDSEESDEEDVTPVTRNVTDVTDVTPTKTVTETKTEETTHTHRAKSDEKSNGTSGPGPITLSDFLGPHSHVLDDCPPVRSQRAQRSVVSWYGPSGMHSSVWKLPTGESVPEPERPRILAMALTGYAGEGKDKIVTREFDGMLRGLIRTEFQVDKPPGGTERALTAGEREAYRRIRSELEADGLGADEAAEQAMNLARGAA